MIRERYGELSPSVIARIAANAEIDPTVFGRLLLPENYKKPTRHPRRRTVTALALALEVPYNWLAHGVGSKQIDAWPALVRLEAESPDPPASAMDEAIAAIAAMAELPEQVQKRAYRTAINSAIDAISAQGETVPVRAYRALVRLDQLQPRIQRPMAG